MMTKTIRTGLAVAAMLIATMTAQAADLPRPGYKAPAYSAPAYANWTGLYVGLNAAYGFGTSNWDVPAIDTAPKGALVGLTVGYNFQTGIWLWGIEGDIDYSLMKGSAGCFGGTCETKDTWLGTARARIGYAGWNNWLPYLTGGAAFGDIRASAPAGDASKTFNIGYTFGAGLEYALWSNWSVKGEYLYVDLGKFDCGITCGAATDNVSFKTNLVRLGVNYRF
jgi:outer membrane immunogenic protein